MPIPIIAGLVAAFLAGGVVGYQLAPGDPRVRTAAGAALFVAIVAPFLLSGAAAFVWALIVGALLGHVAARPAPSGRPAR